MNDIIFLISRSYSKFCANQVQIEVFIISERGVQSFETEFLCTITRFACNNFYKWLLEKQILGVLTFIPPQINKWKKWVHFKNISHIIVLIWAKKKRYQSSQYHYQLKRKTYCKQPIWANFNVKVAKSIQDTFCNHQSFEYNLFKCLMYYHFYKEKTL